MTTLDSVLENLVDCEHKTAPIDDAGNFFAVGTPAMAGNRIDYGQARRISPATFAQWTRRMTPTMGDLLLAREAPVGPVVMIPPEENVAPGQRTVLMRPNPRVTDPRYLHLALSAPATQAALIEKASGSTVAHLNVADIRSFEFPWVFPPLPTQRAIAEVLGALDDKIAANSAACDAVQELAQAVYARVTARCERVQASRVLVPVLGGTPDRANASYWGGGVPWVSARDIAAAGSGVILETDESISVEATAASRAKPVAAGSVIMTARGTVGAVARLGIAAAFNQSCYAFVPTREIPASCLYFVVKDAAIGALAVAHGSVFSTITMRSFEALAVPALSPSDIAVLEGAAAPLLALVSAKAIESRHLATLRDTLLPHLMSGRITVREAEQQVEEVL